MYYGIEQSTDMRALATIVRKFATRSSVEKWVASGGGGFTHKDPEASRNYHHTFRHAYEMAGRVDKRSEIMRRRGTSMYPRSMADNLAHYVMVHGKELT